jgi:hypothetical protein
MTTTIRRVEGRSRRYEVAVEGQEPVLLPSVTSVLSTVIAKPGLMHWARNTALQSVREVLLDNRPVMALDEESIDALIAEAKARPDQVRDEAADYGTTAHELIDAILGDEEPVIPPAYSETIAAFYAWEAEASLAIEKRERMVYSLEHGYAGTLDAIGWNADRGHAVLDWKTSNGLYPETALQVTAYAMAYEEMTGEKVTEAWVVRLGKKQPEFEAKRVDLDACKPTWLDALNLWKGLKSVWMP